MIGALLWLLALASPPCHARDGLPDAVCTPGVAATTDLGVICDGRAKERRNVGRALRARVVASYGTACPRGGPCVLDHLIPIELGGANDPADLWPEPKEEARDKDQVENFLRREVCAARLPVIDAQSAIATNWRAVYQKLRENRRRQQQSHAR